MHVVTAEGVCSCGWDLADCKPPEPTFWMPAFMEETRDERGWTQAERQREWVSHVENAWRERHGFGDPLQAVEVPGPSGAPITFIMQPGHDSLREFHAWGEQSGVDSAKQYYGAYRFADYA